MSECTYCHFQYSTQQEYDDHLDAVHRDEPGGNINPDKTVTKSVTTLDEIKAVTCSLIDQETVRRIYCGFQHLGKTMSMSERAQINWMGILHDPTLLTYPTTISTKDNDDAITLNNTTEATSLAQAAYDYKKDALATGNTIKVAVRAAVDETAVDAAAATYLAGS